MIDEATTARADLHAGCPRCHTLWEVSGYAWQFECKCRRWFIDARGRDSWMMIPGAPLYCCGREMERAVTARTYECACGRSVTDECAIATYPDDGSRGSWRGSWTNSGPMHVMSAPSVAAPVQACACGTARCAGVDCPPVDPPERHADLCDGLMFGASPDDPDAVSLSEDYCINARRRVDEWLVSSMDELMRKCEVAGSPFEKRCPVMFPGRPEVWRQEDYSAARSRLLAAKVAASDAARAEADRRIVLGPIDDPDEA